MSDLVLNFRVAGDGQALSVLRSFKSAAQDTGRALDRAGRSGHTAARETARAWSASKRPLSETERLAMKVARDQAKASRDAANAQVRDAYRVAREKQRIASQAAARHEQSLRRQSQMEQRFAHQREIRETRMAQRLERVRDSQRTDLLGLAVRGGQKLTGAAWGAARGLAFGAGAAAIGLTGAALREQVSLRDSARSLARKGDGNITAEQLLGDAQRTARDVRGTKAKDNLSAVDAFVTETGDLDAARRLQRTFAEVALASGADTTDIARAAAANYKNFGIKSTQDVRRALAGQYIQGKRGSFEVEEAAQYIPSVAAAAASFNIGTGVRAADTLGGLTQIAKDATGRGAPAATAVEAMFRQLAAKSTELSSAGVKFTNRDGSRREIQDILIDAIANVTDKKAIKEGVSASDARLSGLQKIFGEEGIRAIKPLIATYNEALAQGADGAQALRDRFARATDTSGALAEVQRDLASAQQDTSSRLTASWERVSAQVGDVLIPKVTGFVEKLEGVDFKPLIEAIGMTAEAFLNMLKALGLVNDRPTRKEQFGVDSADAGLAALDARKQAAAIQGAAIRERRDLTPTERADIELLNEEAARQDQVRLDAQRSEASAARFTAPTSDAEARARRMAQRDADMTGVATGGGLAAAASTIAGGQLKIEGLDSVSREQAEAARQQLTVMQQGFVSVVEALSRLGVTLQSAAPAATAFNEFSGR